MSFLGCFKLVVTEGWESWRPSRCPRFHSNLKLLPFGLGGNSAPILLNFLFLAGCSRVEVSYSRDTKGRVRLPRTSAGREGQRLPLKDTSPRLFCLHLKLFQAEPKFLKLKKEKKREKAFFLLPCNLCLSNS